MPITTVVRRDHPAEPRPQRKFRSLGRGALWFAAVSLTGGGLTAIPDAVAGSGFAAVEAARRAGVGITLLIWLIASGRDQPDPAQPRHRAAIVAVAAGVGYEMLIGSILGSFVLVATPLILGSWSLRLTWTMRRLMKALEASPAWFPASPR